MSGRAAVLDNVGVVQMTGPPAPNPCDSCPYRRDVPAGLWAEEEYAKLERYDNETLDQPTAVFLCHQNDKNSTKRRVCAGWAGCHDGDNLLALRVAEINGRITSETAQAVVDYVSPVPLFDSGAEAAEHGRTEIEFPGERARAAIAKVSRKRSDLRE